MEGDEEVGKFGDVVIVVVVAVGLLLMVVGGFCWKRKRMNGLDYDIAMPLNFSSS